MKINSYLSLVLLITLNSCVAEKKKKSPTEEASTLATLSAIFDENNLYIGDSIAIAWVIDKGNQSCRLMDGNYVLKDKLEPNGNISYTISNKTVIALMCDGQVRSELKLEAPKIHVSSISTFSVSPLSVKEGSSVTLNVEGEYLKECDLYANGVEIAQNININNTDDSTYTHTPKAKDVNYSVKCVGNQEVELEKAVAVNMIIADDIIASDSIDEISQLFDINEILEPASTALGSSEVADFKTDYTVDTLKKSENKPLRVSTSKATFLDEGSVLYGYEKNHNFANYEKTCNAKLVEVLGANDGVENPSLTEHYEFANYSTLLDEEIKDESLIVENLAHITDFEAVTKSLDEIAKIGTEFDISYSLSNTKINYSEKSEHFGTIDGLFAIEDNVVKPVSSLQPEEKSVSFPAGYPIPPAKNGYTYDPSHPTCSNANPTRTDRVTLNNVNEYCAHSYFKNSSECEYYRKWKRGEYDYRGPAGCIEPFVGEIIENPFAVGVEKGACHNIRPVMANVFTFGVKTFPVSLGRIDKYISTQSSRRIYRGAGEIDCKASFASLATSYDITTDWKVNYAKAQWFVYDTRWPATCSGINCANKVMRNALNDTRYSNIEPAKNYCIDRWKEDDWNSYQAEVQKACKASSVYVNAVSAAQQGNNNEKFVNNCSRDNNCKNLAKGIKQLFDKKLFLDKLDNHFNNLNKEINVAKEARRGFIIPTTDFLFSSLSEIESNIAIIEKGINSIVAIQTATRGNWDYALKELAQHDMIRGFQSSNELKKTVLNYKSLIAKIKVLGKAEIKEISCSYSSEGRFEKFSELRIKEILRNNIENTSVTTKAKNIIDIKL